MSITLTKVNAFACVAGLLAYLGVTIWTLAFTPAGGVFVALLAVFNLTPFALIALMTWRGSGRFLIAVLTAVAMLGLLASEVPEIYLVFVAATRLQEEHDQWRPGVMNCGPPLILVFAGITLFFPIVQLVAIGFVWFVGEMVCLFTLTKRHSLDQDGELPAYDDERGDFDEYVQRADR